MRHDPKTYLWNIQEAAQSVSEWTEGMSFDGYMSDWMIRSAVERQFMIIGKSCERLEHHAETIARRINCYQDFIAMGSTVRLEYDAIPYCRLWKMIQENLPALLDECSAQLAADSR